MLKWWMVDRAFCYSQEKIKTLQSQVWHVREDALQIKCIWISNVRRRSKLTNLLEWWWVFRWILCLHPVHKMYDALLVYIAELCIVDSDRAALSLLLDTNQWADVYITRLTFSVSSYTFTRAGGLFLSWIARLNLSSSLSHCSGGGTSGICHWYDGCHGSGLWKEQTMMKTARPFWMALTARVV